MKKLGYWFVVLALPGLVVSAVAGAAASGALPVPSHCPSCSPCPVCVPCANSAAEPAPLPAAEGKKILQELAKAQKVEFEALEHRQKIEIRELKASQKARLKEWQNSEQDSRHAYFKQHARGAERRAYMQDFLARRKILLSMQADESKQRINEQDVRRKALREEQLQKLKEAQADVAKGRRPPDGVWPARGQ